jgi:hypothetical protein
MPLSKEDTMNKPVNGKLPAPYSRMTSTDLDAQVGKFDREFIESEAKPLTPELKRKLRRARRKPGRPVVGKGARRVLVTIERDLLRRADAFRKKRKLSRAQLIAKGIEAVLCANE